jgi:N-methylhydantoinase B
LGVEKVTRALADMSLVAEVERTKDAPFGLFGGKPGKSNIGVLQPGTPREKRIGKVAGYPLPKGEEWHLSTGGGGGWGDPRARRAASVLDDVVQGYVSLESARRDYGVSIKQVDDQYVLDEAGTANLRTRREACG